MIQLDEWYDYVMPHCQGAPDSLFQLGVRQAITTFCEQTGYLQIDRKPIPLEDGVSQYDIGAGLDELRVTQVRLAKLSNGATLLPVTRFELDGIGGSWSDTVSIYPTMYLLPTPSIIVLYPIPDKIPDDLELLVRVVAAPSFDATSVPDALYNNFKDIIAFGARFYIKQTPNQPSFDMGQATIQYKLFIDGIGSVKKSMLSGFAQRNLRVRPVRFG